MATSNTSLDAVPDVYWNSVERGFLSTTLLLIMIATIIGNTFVIVVILRNRGMRTRTNILLFNLALTDLAACVFDMPFSLVTMITGRWVFDSPAVCMLMGFTTPLFIVASIHTLMYISIHRFVTVRNPHSHSLTKRRIMVMNAAAWAWGIITASLSISGLTQVDHTPYTTQCSPKYPNSPSSYAHLVLAIITCYAVPVVVIVVCSIGVWLSIRSYGKRMLSSSTVDVDEIYAQQRHITVTLFMVVVAFIVSWTPLVVYSIYSTVWYHEGIVNRLANPITTMFGFSDSAFNPIIYAFRSEAFREGYKQLLWKNRQARRSSSSFPSMTSQRTQIYRNSTSSTRNTAAASASDYITAHNSSGIDKDATAMTIMTLINDDELRLPPPGVSVEMDWLNRGRTSDADAHSDSAFLDDLHSDETRPKAGEHQRHVVAFSDAEEFDDQPRAGEGVSGNQSNARKGGLMSYLSFEHLDTIEDHHHHHHHHAHKSQKRRKFRGKIGGLHRARGDSVQDDDETCELSSVPQGSGRQAASASSNTSRNTSPVSSAPQGRSAVHHTAANDSQDHHGARPIYNNSGRENRPSLVSKPVATVAMTSHPSGAQSSAGNSIASGRNGPPATSLDGVPVSSRRAATTEWVTQQQLQTTGLSGDAQVAPPDGVVRQQRRLRKSVEKPEAATTTDQLKELEPVSGRRSKSKSLAADAASGSSQRRVTSSDDDVEGRTGPPRASRPTAKTSSRRMPPVLPENSRSTDI